jgi:hypothetical protein
MKLTNTIIALVLLAALGGVLYYLNKHPKTDEGDNRPKLFAFKSEDVKQFTIEEKDKPPATVRHNEHATPAQPNWEAVTPSGIPVDESQVKSFLDDVVKIQYSAIEDTANASPAEYGLDQPVKTFKFETAQGPVTLAIGKENPGGIAKYGKLSSVPGVILLDVGDTAALDKTFFDLRDKRIMPVAMDQLDRMELEFNLGNKDVAPLSTEEAKRRGLFTKPPKMVFSKQADQNWQLMEPPARTDYGTSNYLVTGITGATMDHAQTDKPDSLAPFGLDRPAIRVNLVTRDGKTRTLLVGNKAPKQEPNEFEQQHGMQPAPPGYYAKDADLPTVFQISQTLYDQLNQDIENYRNRFLFDFSTSNARRIEVTGADGNLRLDRKAEEWVSGDNKKPNVDKVNAFLTFIHDLRIQKYPEDRPGHFAEFGLDNPWMTVTVTFGESNQQETVLFGARDKKVYAARKDAPSVYEMIPDAREQLAAKLKDVL